MVHPPDPMRAGWRRRPAPSRLRLGERAAADVLAAHDRALDAGIPTYADPVSVFSVFTADFLAARGDCCDSGCRHCPFVE